MDTWKQITCEEREALIDRLGRSHNGFSAASGVRAVASRTDMTGERTGTPHIFTEWGYDEDHPVLRDERWPDNPRPCEHHVPA